MDERTVRKYDCFVVLTTEDRTYWGNLPNMIAIPNVLSYSTTELHLSPLTARKVTAVGRYGYQKGFDYLIEAWEIIHCVQPAWTPDITSDGEWTDRLQRQIKRKRLNHCVFLKPPTGQIEEEYRRTSLLVLSSRYEGLSMVLLEAQSFGLPTASFACKCGPGDAVTDDKNGFLVSVGNLPMSADRVMRLMEDEGLCKRMGMNVYHNSEIFLEERIMQCWIDMLDKLVSQRRVVSERRLLPRRLVCIREVH